MKHRTTGFRCDETTHTSDAMWKLTDQKMVAIIACGACNVVRTTSMGVPYRATYDLYIETIPTITHTIIAEGIVVVTGNIIKKLSSQRCYWGDERYFPFQCCIELPDVIASDVVVDSKVSVGLCEDTFASTQNLASITCLKVEVSVGRDLSVIYNNLPFHDMKG